MISLASGKEVLQNTCKNVLGRLLGKPAESVPESTPPNPVSSKIFPVVHARSRAETFTSASMKSNAQVKRSIVNRVFEGTFEDGIEILDDDDNDDVQEVAVPSLKTRTRPNKAEQARELRKETPARTRATISSSDDDARLGRGALHESKILQTTDLPSRRTRRDMPFHQVRHNFTSGGLKHVDTLHQSGTSSKQDHFLRNTRRNDLSTTAKPPASRTTRSQLQLQYPDPLSPPTKRRRLDFPQNSSETEDFPVPPQHLLNGNTETVSSAVSDRDLKEMYGITGTDSHQERVKKVRPTPLRNIDLERSSANGARRWIPDNDTDLDGALFMKRAKQERKNRLSTSEEELDQSQLISRAVSKNPSHSTADEEIGRTQRQSSNAERYFATPRTSKMSRRLSDGTSPDVLHDSEKTSARTLRKLPTLSNSPTHALSASKRFSLKQFICSGFLEADAYDVEVDEKRKTFGIHYKDPEIMKDALTNPIPVSKIVKMSFRCDEDANLVMLMLSSSNLPSNRCFLDFGTSQKACNQFLSLIQELEFNIKVVARSSEWMHSAFARATNRDLHQKQDQRAEHTPLQSIAEPPLQSEKFDTQNVDRQRRVDQLDAGPITTGRELRQHDRKAVDYSGVETRTSASSVRDGSLPAERERETRSAASKRTSEDVTHTVAPIQIDSRRTGPAWKGPLIYPKTGKARATVTWDDLERLNDEEFLNDNLVSLFMRYLQEHMDPEQAKKTHFFNTFFYDSLTRAKEGGSRRQINYRAVANWTKNVNLFSRDYVVVPVNESAHWYVMIICNLRHLKDFDDKDEDVVEVAGPEQGIDDPKTILESDLPAANDQVEDSDYVEGAASTDTGSTRRRPGRRKSQTPRGRRKYATNQPIIMTLDSLDQGRSGTASTLRTYLVEEAKDKLDLDIDKDLILGMTAKSIPLQSNFSDCGLYLCMYLEQFVREPRVFVRSILQREENLSMWPRKLPSASLRQRLYEMLQELHRAQDKKVDPILPDIGRLLIKEEDFPVPKRDTRVEELYEPSKVAAACDHYEKHYPNDKRSESGDDMLLANPLLLVDASSRHRPSDEEVLNGVGEPRTDANSPIVLEDANEPVQARDGLSSRFFRRTRSNDNQNTPQGLAERLRRQRSNARSVDPSNAEINKAIDLTIPTRLDSSHRQKSSSIERQDLREVSISTDYLTGDALYQGSVNDNRDSALSQQQQQQHHHHHHHHHHQRGREKEQEEEGLKSNDDFQGFDDSPVSYQPESRRFRDTSVVPESVQSDQPESEVNDPMLLD